jgi:hypothetical protein
VSILLKVILAEQIIVLMLLEKIRRKRDTWKLGEDFIVASAVHNQREEGRGERRQKERMRKNNERRG